MSEFFSDYHKARRHAEGRANELGVSFGIEKANEFGRKGFTVKMIPGPTKRQGWELRCEAVEPAGRTQ